MKFYELIGLHQTMKDGEEVKLVVGTIEWKLRVGRRHISADFDAVPVKAGREGRPWCIHLLSREQLGSGICAEVESPADFVSVVRDDDVEKAISGLVDGLRQLAEAYAEVSPDEVGMPPGFVPCSVEFDRYGCMTVTFADGREMFLQSDYDQSAFGVACGVLDAPNDWDGTPSKLSPDWYDTLYDADIKWCPEEYQNNCEE